MESVFFENLNGKKIFCYFSEPENSNRKIVIMSHGFRGSSVGSARTFVDFQRILNKEGYSVLRFDQPNSGNSDGDYLDSSMNEWIKVISYFVKKYLDEGYKVALMGQSMGGATSMFVAGRHEFKGKISCLILWVPGVNGEDFEGGAEEVFEEDGQKYKGKFWIESRNADFFKCMESYDGKAHVVYGEKDRYISQELIDKVINKAKEKGFEYMILRGQDHSPWEYDIAQEVYEKEIEFLKRNF